MTTTIEVLERLEARLSKARAKIHPNPIEGTTESAMHGGLSVALALVQEERERAERSTAITFICQADNRQSLSNAIDMALSVRSRVSKGLYEVTIYRYSKKEAEEMEKQGKKEVREPREDTNGTDKVTSDGLNVWVHRAGHCVAKFSPGGREYFPEDRNAISDGRSHSLKGPLVDDWYDFIHVVQARFHIEVQNRHRPNNLRSAE